MVKQNDFSDIIDFYSRLDKVIPREEGENPCGNCFECCRYLFYFSRYEFDYLKYFLRIKTDELSIKFVRLLPGESDPRFNEKNWACPLLNERTGCIVYEARPLPCRMMGPYLPYNSKKIDNCIYNNPVVYEFAEEIPLWDDFVRILKRHPSPPGYFVRLENHDMIAKTNF